ncbi:MAG: DUF2332 family protein [Pseudomonadota bacterium]
MTIDVPAVFDEQAGACGRLGSPFMEQLMHLIGHHLTPGTPVGARVFGWQQDPSAQASALALRLAGALHAVRLGGDPGLAAVYPPNRVRDETLWAAVANALDAHADTLLDWLKSAPQTNEVRRAAVVVPVLHALEKEHGLPLSVSELGCSAGLNLRADQFCLKAGDVTLGDPGSPVVLQPEWRGQLPVAGDPQVASRQGVDLNPLDPEEDALRILAYIWPDQPERVARTQAATDIAKRTPARVDRGDAIAWLERELSQPREGYTHLIFHTIAWQYFPPEVQARGEAVLAAAGARATPSTPLARLSMEPDGASASVRLTCWPGGATREIARADYHARWVEWFGTKEATDG